MVEVAESFVIDQPVERVWAFFQNVPAVVTCMPGLELTGDTGGPSYTGKVTVKVGPIAVSFDGEATITSADAAARRAQLTARGVDKRGGNRAAAEVVYELASADGGTEVRLSGDIKLNGALAQIGRTGILQDVASQLTAEFAAALHTRLAAGETAPDAGDVEVPAPDATPAVGGGALLLGALWRRLVRLFAALSGRD